MKFYIHIGLPKCASTSLQAYFSERPDLYFAGKRLPPSDRFRTPGLAKVIRQYIPGLSKDAFDPRLCEPVINHSLRDASLSGLNSYLISDEVLSGIGFKHAFANGVEPSEIFSRLRLLFGADIIVILVVREQRSLLRSYWRQLILAHYPLTFHSFVELQIESLEKPSINRFRVLPHLLFDHYLELVHQYFSEVVVAPYELLTIDATYFESFARQLGAVGDLGRLPLVKERKEAEYYVRKLRRNLHSDGRLARLTSPADRDFDDRFKQSQGVKPTDVVYDVGFTDRQEERLTELFAPSNRSLARITNLDFGKMGYIV